MSVKKTVLGLGFAIAMFANGAYGGTPQVFISVVDTVLYPNIADPTGALGTRQLTVRMNNPAVHVGGFSVALSISEPSIMNFGYNDIDTVLPHWRYFTDCTPPPCHPDSVLECPDSCFNYNTPVYTQGTRSADFDLIDGSRLSEIVLQVTGKAQSGAGPVMQPGNGVLFRVPLVIFPISDSFSLSQRQVEINLDPIFTTVSDSSGNTIWRAADTTLALTHGTVTVPYSMKGDCNFDGVFSPTDVVVELGWVFAGSPEPVPSAAVGDVNCDGQYTPSDVVLLLGKVFNGTPLPC
ncbi:MAG: hypothetical protein L0Z48_07155 [candidate division Zixibacteria bacterium]|nr:hypothetical protein [candidate division Zixibacteria bacterium]